MFLRLDGGSVQGNARWLLGYFCQSKVEQLSVPSLRDEDVGRLNVPMNNANGMCSIQCISDFDAQIDYRFDVQRLPCNLVLQRHAIQKFHGDEWLPIVLADLVYRANVGMVESRGGTSFATKAFQRLRVMGNIFGEELQGDEATKLGVLGFVDDTHPAASEFLDHPVVRDGLTDKLG